MTYIGIDPGKKGAMAIFNDIGRLEIHEFSTSVFKSILIPFFDPYSDEKEAPRQIPRESFFNASRGPSPLP